MKFPIRSSFVFAAGALLLLGMTPAQAASPGDDAWGGAYVGIIGGAQWSRARFALPGDKADELVSDHDTGSSWTAGGLVGIDFRTKGAVLGIEADLVAEDARQQVTACTVPDGCWTPAHDSFTTLNHLKERLNGHVRARAGVASGGTLFFVAGGYSVARTRLDLIGECFNPGDPTTPLLFNFSRKKTLSGFNIGAGVEQRLGRHFSLRAEYVYDDYGHRLYRGDGAEWNDRRISVHDSNLRMAVSYRF